MIELPEARVLARQINRTVVGKRVTGVTAGQTPHKFAWYSGDPAMYGSRLAGKTVNGADIFSGSLRVAVGDMSLFLTTPIRFHAVGSPRPTIHQFLVEFDDSSALSCTVQMWGAMCCCPQGTEASGGVPQGHPVRDCPSPLDDAFDRPYFDRLVEAESPGNLPAKAFLAAEQRLPGLGNGVLRDILWTCGVHPKRKMGTLTDGDLGRMFQALKSVLADMVAAGGRDTEQDLFGKSGGYRTVLSKNTVGTACPVCGSAIQKDAYFGGAIYYCEKCQPL